ncbi:hypothetical protein F5Y15DRAFT_397504 [Xylariaceae sp. FL0016]|nr:hypothetical protein F5Y15DRAFT_397504 [Xylariaceae sp. FL0016]
MVLAGLMYVCICREVGGQGMGCCTAPRLGRSPVTASLGRPWSAMGSSNTRWRRRLVDGFPRPSFSSCRCRGYLVHSSGRRLAERA